MKIDVMLFAQAKQIAGHSVVSVDVSEECTVADLIAALIATTPKLSPLQSRLLVAVNNQFASSDTVIHNTDTIACFPPVSGG